MSEAEMLSGGAGVMAIHPMVQSDVVTGDPAELLIRHGMVVDIDMSNARMVAYYRGADNLAPLPANQTGDDADHSTLAD